MKTKLFFIFFITTQFVSAQYYISEIVPSPPNSTTGFLNDSDNTAMQDYQSDVDDGIEYFEFRGTPNATIDDDVYFISIDGDDENPNRVQDAINLSAMSFGSNGILVIVADITMNTGTGAVDLAGADISGTKFINPYAIHLAASSANVVTVQLFADTIEWTDERNAANDGSTADGTNETLNKFNLDGSLTTPSISYDGSINDQSATYMIVKSTAGDPDGEEVDMDANGVLDGVATAWTIYDSVAILDDDDDEFAYSEMIFIEEPDIMMPLDVTLTYDTNLSPSIILLNQYPNYVVRQGLSTGFAPSADGTDNDDWMAGRVSSLSYPDWSFSNNSDARNFPNAQLAGNKLSDFGGLTIGEVNVTFSTLSLSEELTSSFKVYPNPASDIVTIQSNTEISSVTLYNVLGNEVLSINESVESIDVSGLSKGVYLLKIESENTITTEKLVVK